MKNLEVAMVILASLLFIFQPIEAIGGPRIPFFLLVLLALWMIYGMRNSLRRPNLQQRSLLWIFALLWIPGVFSLIHTYSMEKTLSFVLLFPVLWLAVIPLYRVLRQQKFQEILLLLLVLTCVAWIVDGYIQFFLGSDLFGVGLTEEGRVTGPFSGNWRIGSLLVISIPLVLYWMKERQSGLTWQFVYLAALLGVLFLTGVRTNLVAFFVAVFLYYVWNLGEFAKLCCGLVPAAVMLGWVTTSHSDITQKKLETFEKVDELSYQSLNTLLSGRLEIWTTAWHMFQAHPLTGIGTKAFNHAYNEFSPEGANMVAINGKGGAYHAHHPWMAMLAEGGVIGFSGLVTVVVIMFRVGINSIKQNGMQNQPWLLVFILILFPLNSMLPIYIIWWFPIVLLAIVAHIAMCDQRQEETLSRQDRLQA